MATLTSNITDTETSAGEVSGTVSEAGSLQGSVALGEAGTGGKGFSPIVSVTDIDGGHRVTITDVEDTKTFDVMDGADGKDGVYIGTDEPPADANVWIDPSGDASITTEEWTFTLEDGSTVTKAVYVG